MTTVVVAALAVATAAQSFALGGFTVDFDADGAFAVSRGGRVLLAPAAGVPQITAGEGAEQVAEETGHLEFEDHEVRACGSPVLAGAPVQDGLRLRAVFALGDCTEEIALELAVDSESARSLRFAWAAPGLNRIRFSYASTPDQKFFGFGESFSVFDIKGRKIEIVVREQGIGRGLQPITQILNAGPAMAGGSWQTTYAPVPQYITSDITSLYLDNTEISTFDLRAPDSVTVEVFSGEMVGRILYGETHLELIEAYTEQIGRMPALPDWLNRGVVLGMQGGPDVVNAAVAKVLDAGLPLAAVWLQDYCGKRQTAFGSRLMWNWEVNTVAYPGWDELVANLTAMDVRMMTYANPFLTDVTGEPGFERNLFAEAAAQGFLIKDAEGDPILLDQGGFEAALVDFTNPAARVFFKDVIKENLLGRGSFGWMADFSEAMPYFDAVLDSGVDSRAYHNAYPVAWAQINQEAIAEAGMDGEVVYFMRAAFTRSPGLTTLFWLGDQLQTWDEFDGLKTAVIGMLTSGLSGFALQHSDIGGYTAINTVLTYLRTKELFVRWCELSAFTVMYRTHEGNLPDDSFQYDSDEEALALFVRMGQVWAAWADLRAELTRESAATGHPILRPMFVEFPNDDPLVYDLDLQFMVGSDLLIAPAVDQGATTVTLYLPRGTAWVHMWTDATFAGGEWVTIDAPVGFPPVFFAESSAAGRKFQSILAEARLL